MKNKIAVFLGILIFLFFFSFSCNGKDDGFNAFNLNPRPADLTKVCVVKRSEYIIRVVTEGTKAVGKSSLCPPYGRTIQKEDIAAIIVYLETFKDDPAPYTHAIEH